jgi:hypothetical protein
VNLAQGTIDVQSDQTQVRTITVGEGVGIYAQKQVAVSDLKLGDRVYISGIPSVIVATSIEGQEAGTEAKFQEAMRAAMPAPPGNAPNPPPGQPQPEPTVGITGSVVSLSPLTIEVSNGKKTEVLCSETTKVSRIEVAKLGDLKPDSDIVAFGPDESGVVKATLVFQGDSQIAMRAMRDLMGQRFRGMTGPGGPGGRGGGGGNGPRGG